VHVAQQDGITGIYLYRLWIVSRCIPHRV